MVASIQPSLKRIYTKLQQKVLYFFVVRATLQIYWQESNLITIIKKKCNSKKGQTYRNMKIKWLEGEGGQLPY